MSGWSWRNAYPGKRAVTLLLDPDAAAELLDRAAREGRLVSSSVILGAVSATEPSGPVEPVELPEGRCDGPPADPEPVQTPLPPPSMPLRTPLERPSTAPQSRQEHQEQAIRQSSVLDEAPPARQPPSATVKHLDPDMRAAIDAAVAAGKVTVCPPCKHAIEPGQPDPAHTWNAHPRARGRRSRKMTEARP